MTTPTKYQRVAAHQKAILEAEETESTLYIRLAWLDVVISALYHWFPSFYIPRKATQVRSYSSSPLSSPINTHSEKK